LLHELARTYHVEGSWQISCSAWKSPSQCWSSGLRTSISAAIGGNFAERLQPISHRDGRNRQQMVPAFSIANKKEFEAHDTVNESKATIKCLRIMNLPGLVPHNAGNK
jgi:hypothetical protein